MSAIDATKPTAGNALTADVRANFLAAKNEIDANTASAAAALAAANAHAALTTNPHSTTAAQVGLGSVNNTPDASKPVSTAQQAALDLKAPLASPTFTGTVTAPAFILSSVITDATTARTLSAGDNGKVIYFTNAAAITLTMAVAAAGFACTIVQGAAGQITFAAGGQTMTIAGGLTKTASAGAMATIMAPVANTFFIAGTLA